MFKFVGGTCGDGLLHRVGDLTGGLVGGLEGKLLGPDPSLDGRRCGIAFAIG